MARFRRMASSLHPVNRIKHVVDSSATLAANTTLNTPVITTDDNPAIANTADVLTGSKVNGIYLKVEVASNETEDVGAIPNVYMAVFKNPNNALTGLPIANVVGASFLKKWFIHQEMIMIENSKGGNPRILFNGVIVIPKGMRRFAPEDRLVVSVFSPAIDIALCLQCHYKEFR